MNLSFRQTVYIIRELSTNILSWCWCNGVYLSSHILDLFLKIFLFKKSSWFLEHNMTSSLSSDGLHSHQITNQYGPKLFPGPCWRWDNKLKQLWRKKLVQPSTSKVYLMKSWWLVKTVLHCPVWQQLCQVELWHVTFNVFVYLHVMAFFNEIDCLELIDQQEATSKHSVIKIQDILYMRWSQSLEWCVWLLFLWSIKEHLSVVKVPLWSEIIMWHQYRWHDYRVEQLLLPCSEEATYTRSLGRSQLCISVCGKGLQWTAVKMRVLVW